MRPKLIHLNKREGLGSAGRSCVSLTAAMDPSLSLLETESQVLVAGFSDWTLLYLCDAWLLLATIFDRLNSNEDNITFLGQVIVALEHQPTLIGKWFIRNIISINQQRKKLNKYWGGWRNKSFMVQPYIQKLIKLQVGA